MDDLIRRQAAIDATWEEPTYSDPLNVLTEVRDRLKGLPSAQPEIIRCKDCMHFLACNAFTGRCALRGDYIFTNDFCSYAVERRTDER